MTKVTKTTIIPNNNQPASLPTSGGQWDNSLKQTLKQAPQGTPVQTMQLTLDKAPQNYTNQHGMLSPQQMAQHLSRELARRSAQSHAFRKTRKRGYSNIGDDLSTILDENKDISSLLDSGDEASIASFLAFFQQEMERHLAGMEFGEIIYDQDLIEQLMSKF